MLCCVLLTIVFCTALWVNLELRKMCFINKKITKIKRQNRDSYMKRFLRAPLVLTA